jgi:hypothetical protein
MPSLGGEHISAENPVENERITNKVTLIVHFSIPSLLWRTALQLLRQKVAAYFLVPSALLKVAPPLKTSAPSFLKASGKTDMGEAWEIFVKDGVASPDFIRKKWAATFLSCRAQRRQEILAKFLSMVS